MTFLALVSARGLLYFVGSIFDVKLGFFLLSDGACALLLSFIRILALYFSDVFVVLLRLFFIQVEIEAGGLLDVLLYLVLLWGDVYGVLIVVVGILLNVGHLQN